MHLVTLLNDVGTLSSDCLGALKNVCLSRAYICLRVCQSVLWCLAWCWACSVSVLVLRCLVLQSVAQRAGRIVASPMDCV
jgi:hypothetical protein